MDGGRALLVNKRIGRVGLLSSVFNVFGLALKKKEQKDKEEKTAKI
jgi:hypothetical protein